MNHIIRSLIIGVAMAAPAMATAQSQIAPYELNVKEFTELKVADGINVEYYCNPQMAGKVMFETIPDFVPLIVFDSNGKGKLEIKLSTREIKYTGLPTVRVYSSFLSKVENTGDSTLTVVSVAPVPKLEARLGGNGRLSVNGIRTTRLESSISSGKGTITLTGSATDAKISLTGTGTIDATGLKVNDAECKIIGTGWIKCNVADNLKVTGLGTGGVSFLGNPITRVKALSVKVKRLEE